MKTINLKELRQEYGLTERELELKTGVRESTIKNLENGGGTLYSNIKKLCDYFEVELPDLKKMRLELGIKQSHVEILSPGEVCEIENGGFSKLSNIKKLYDYYENNKRKLTK